MPFNLGPVELGLLLICLGPLLAALVVGIVLLSRRGNKPPPPAA